MKGDKNSLVNEKDLTKRTSDRYKYIKELINKFEGKKIANIGTNYHMEKEMKTKETVFIEDIYEYETTEKYDLIICSSVLPHLINAGQAMQRIKNLLNKNGKLLITSNNDISLHKRINGIKFTPEDYHYCLYDEETIKNLLKDTGYEIEETIHEYESKYQKLLGKTFCGDIYFLCKKKE